MKPEIPTHWKQDFLDEFFPDVAHDFAKSSYLMERFKFYCAGRMKRIDPDDKEFIEGYERDMLRLDEMSKKLKMIEEIINN
jgi:hypothetical protein